MILHPPLLSKVLNGSKTQHRIQRKPSQFECPMLSGKTYGITREPRGEWLTRIVVTHDRAGVLNDMTPKDAQLEGFKRVDEAVRFYENAWQVWDPEHRQPVWVITFELDPSESGRFLAPGTGYHTQRVGEEFSAALLDLSPEARQQAEEDAARRAASRARTVDPLDAGQVPDSAFVTQQAKAAHRHAEEQRAAAQSRLERMPLPDRVARVRTLVREKGIPHDRFDAAVIRQLEKMERRVERE
jgi:hypothetical protein